MTPDEIQQRLMVLIQNRFGGLPKLDDSFAALGIDSLAMAEFSLALEREFGIRLDDGVLDITTLSELAIYLEALLKKQNS